jgi:hypothetical protein
MLVALCNPSVLMFAIRAWMRASLAADFRRFADPSFFREWARDARAGAVYASQQRLDAQVDPDRRSWPVMVVRDRPVHLYGERHQPPLCGA